MRIKIEFNTDNAAFKDIGLNQEIYNILTQARAKIIRQLARDPECICTAPESDDKLLDTNGNTVGTIEISDDAPVLIIEHDDDAQNMFIDDGFGTFVCWHKRLNLGQINTTDPDRWLEENGPFSIKLPLYLYEHGGLCISLDPFTCPFDSGQVGWVVASADEIKELLNVSELDDKTIAVATESLKQHVKYYNYYLQGECWGYTYGNDSCWGFIGSTLEETGLLEAIGASEEIIREAWENRK